MFEFAVAAGSQVGAPSLGSASSMASAGLGLEATLDAGAWPMVGRCGWNGDAVPRPTDGRRRGVKRYVLMAQCELFVNLTLVESEAPPDSSSVVEYRWSLVRLPDGTAA